MMGRRVGSAGRIAAAAGLLLGWTALAMAQQPLAEAAQAPPLPDGQAVQTCVEGVAGMSCIPGGAFLRGSNDGPTHATPLSFVWLQTFLMDQHEVTVAEYEACVKKGDCDEARTKFPDFSRPRQPKVGVSWFQAVAYCEAMGKHLPTEAEWEKAARGTDGRTFSWGNEPATCERAVLMDARGRSCGVENKGKVPYRGRTFEVGSRPPGLYGLYDMAGNSWEWVYDWYSSDYDACGLACRGVDPKGPCEGKEPCQRVRRRVVRGGSWHGRASRATAFYRRSHFPANEPYYHFGLRCAASVEEAAKLAE